MTATLAAAALAFASPEPPGAPQAPAASEQTAEVTQPYVPPDDPRELLVVDDEMRAYFDGAITRRLPDATALRQLVEAIIMPRGLAFMYDAESTYDARTAFRRRHGNCVSFAMLVVAVSRDFGFEASFQNIETSSKWDRFGEIIVAVQHINVRVRTEDGTFVVDLRPDLVRRIDEYGVRVVSDAHTFAEFYNNVGFFRLVDGHEDEALRYMVRATEVDPSCASAWANRATLHARLGQLNEARAGFDRSLRLDSRGLGALVGFVNVLQQLGTPQDLRLAARLERRAQTLREANPYYQEYLAQRARDHGDWAAADKHLRRAIELKDNEPEFYAERVNVLRQLGREAEAKRMAEKLAKVRNRLASASVYLVP